MQRPAPKASSESMPDDLVTMGYVGGAFGIRGWIKVAADTEYADSLQDYPVWWLGREGVWQAYNVVESAVQPKCVNAKLEGIDDRDIAQAMRGQLVAVPRSAMPAAEEGEYYWADLIGLDVVNTLGERLGVVDNLLSTGANDVLVVKEGETERLLPFVASVVLTVDLPGRRIEVDWGLDY